MERRVAIAFGMLLACCPCAFALNPSLDISQYAQKAWTDREGFFKVHSYAIAQTPDGYLWLGTDFGLFRFNGVRFVPWQPPDQYIPCDRVRSLLARRDGRLRIGTRKGLASLQNGKLTLITGSLLDRVLPSCSRIVKDHMGWHVWDSCV